MTIIFNNHNINTNYYIMKAQNKLNGKLLINFLLIAFRGLFFLGALSLIIWALIGIISIFADVPTFKTSYPVTFMLAGEGSLLAPNDTEIPKFVMPYAQGTIVSEGVPKNAAILYSLESVFLILCTLFILKYLCQILEAAYTGQFLIDENADSSFKHCSMYYRITSYISIILISFR